MYTITYKNLRTGVEIWYTEDLPFEDVDVVNERYITDNWFNEEYLQVGDIIKRTHMKKKVYYFRVEDYWSKNLKHRVVELAHISNLKVIKALCIK